MEKLCHLSYSSFLFWFSIFCFCVFMMFFWICLWVIFSHVLHKNAAVVVQTDLSLLHFVFVLDFGIRIFFVLWYCLVSLFSVSLSPRGCHPPAAFTHDSLLEFLWGFLWYSLYPFSGIQLQFFPASKELSSLVLIERLIHHQTDQPLPWSGFSVFFKTMFYWGDVSQIQKV